MFKRILSGMLVFGMAAIAPPVLAQSATCGERHTITTSLANNYGEFHVGGGLQSGTQMIEVWSSPETGSFTILLTRANGISCIVSSGQSWDSFEPMIPAKGIDS